MKRRMMENCRGFTLVEVLMAMTILAVGLLSIAGMQVVSLKTNASANTLTTNAALAEGIMEQILSWPLDDPRLAADADDVPWVFDDQTVAVMQRTTSEAVGNYTAAYSVDINYDSGSGPIANVTRIEVKVTQVDAGQNVMSQDTDGNWVQRRILTLVGFKRAV
jgi:type IV pilus assembly protein PilV